MWADILTHNIQGKVFRELWVELMNFPVDYKYDEINYEVVGDNSGVPKAHTCTQYIGKNTRYYSYD